MKFLKSDETYWKIIVRITFVSEGSSKLQPLFNKYRVTRQCSSQLSVVPVTIEEMLKEEGAEGRQRKNH